MRATVEPTAARGSWESVQSRRLRRVTPLLPVRNRVCVRRDGWAAEERVENAMTTEAPEIERHFFEMLPVAMLVEDASGARAVLDELRRSGVEDVAEHLRTHPEDLRCCASAVRIVDANAEAIRLFGAKAKDELLAGLDRVFSLESMSGFADAVVELAQGRRNFSFEAVNQTLCGARIDLGLHVSIAPGHEGDWRRVFLVATDITERVNAQRSTEEMAERYRALVEDQPELVCRFLPDGTLTYVNAAYASYFGMTVQECQGFNFFELIPEESREPLRIHLAGFSRRRQTSRSEHEVVRADGSIGWMQWTDRALFDEGSDSPAEFQSVGVDITDLKDTQRHLAESEARFRGLFTGSGVGIAIFDIDCSLLEANPAFGKMFGYADGELVGKALGDLAHSDDGRRAEKACASLAAGATEHSRLELRFLDRSAEVVWGLATISIVRARDGSPKFFIVSIKDVSEQKRIEAERRQLERQVREAQKLESLGLLAGGIAHDFNNLLMGVLGNADLALRALPKASPVRVPLESIEATARRAADLANQMLAYSGKGRFVVETVDLTRLVEEMSRLAHVSVTKKTSLQFDLDRKLPGIEADVTQVRQVVLNLVTNAAEALGDASGAISISTGVMECSADYLLRTVFAEGIEPGRFVYVEVADSGVGMSAEVQERIFDPFFTTKFTGRGLGMAAVLGIVRGHGGAVHIESEPDRGTTIRILFPVSSEGEVEEQADVTPDAEWRGHGQVLLIEDEPVVRSVAGRMLEHLGFEVAIAEDGVDGTEAFRQRPGDFRLVILDMAMPRMSGEEAFRLIRGIRHDVPVLLSSGYHEDEVAALLEGGSISGFIQKPYRLAALRDGIRRVLGED